MIPLDAPLLNGNERKYLNECIDTNWISWQGRFVNKLETDIAQYCGTKHGIAVVNGTYAIVIALQALGVGPGDDVIVPTFTMSATVFAIKSVGANPVFVDNAPNSVNLDPIDVQRKITANTRAIIAVHLYGRPVDVLALKELVGDIPIIEDAAESFGATINGQVVGGMGTIACHSFHNKIIGSGEGGAITVNDDALAAKVHALRVPPPDNAGGGIIVLNNRMSNLAAAVAVAQLEQVGTIIKRRRAVANLYTGLFKSMSGVKTFQEADNERCVYWRYQILLTNGMSNVDFVAKLKLRGIEARPVFTLMSNHPSCQGQGPFPVAAEISMTGVDLPSGPTLTTEQIVFIAKAVEELAA